MSTIPHMHTLARTFAEIERQAPGAPWVPLGNFMMDFFRNYPDRRSLLLANPLQHHAVPGPEATDQEKEIYQWAVFCAASAEYLAHRYHLNCPSWVHVYEALPEPWYFAPMATKKE